MIPTDIKGIYIVDSLGTYGNTISGTNRETAREEYEDYLEGYLGSDYATTQDNLVVSQANGKLAVLGLAEGTYYLKEVKAPDGYNSLSTPVELTVNAETTTSFNVFADADGNVADIQASDGTYLENTYMLTNTTVHNSKGVVLPSTGGEGTFWLITIGTVVALAFAVLLITHKKMSVYHD